MKTSGSPGPIWEVNLIHTIGWDTTKQWTSHSGIEMSQVIQMVTKTALNYVENLITNGMIIDVIDAFLLFVKK